MERMTRLERAEAVAVAMAEGSFRVHSEALAFMRRCEDIGARLHRIYERQCNGHQDSRGNWDEEAANRDERREEKLETELRAMFTKHGLGLYLNGDPRGNPVGILTPKTGKFNTMGGREAGWRL